MTSPPIVCFASDLSLDQTTAIHLAQLWSAGPTAGVQAFCLGGGAGTGKTTVAKYVMTDCDLRSYSWRTHYDAIEAGEEPPVPAGHLHCLRADPPSRCGVDARGNIGPATWPRVAYSPRLTSRHSVASKTCTMRSTNLRRAPNRPKPERATIAAAIARKNGEIDALEEPDLTFRPDTILCTDRLLVDEASMITAMVHGELQSAGRPIQFHGDHAQLQPVRGEQDGARPPAARLYPADAASDEGRHWRPPPCPLPSGPAAPFATARQTAC